MQVGGVTTLSQVENTQQKDSEKKLQQVCDDFSSLFVSMLWKEMRNTIPDDGLIKKSMAEKIFQEMSDDEASKNMAKNDGFSLSKVLYDQLKAGVLSSKK